VGACWNPNPGIKCEPRLFKVAPPKTICSGGCPKKMFREKAKHYWGISPNIHIMTTPKILDKRLHVKFYIQKINYVSGVKKQIWVTKIIVRSSILVYYA
jgi:hypothetical protein